MPAAPQGSPAAPPAAGAPRTRRSRLRTALLLVGSSVLVGIGIVTVGLAAVVGSCSAFGGRCPSDPEPLLQDDVFGMASSGAAAVLAGLVLVVPGLRRRWPVAVAVVLLGAVMVGLVVRS